MHKKFLIFAIFLFFLIPFISASSYNIEFNQVDNKVLIEHKISLDNSQTISLDLPQDATSFSSNLNYTLSANKLTIFGKNIDVSYITQSALEKSKEGYYFVSKITFNSGFPEVSIKFILDKGYFVSPDKIFPKPEGIETNGQQISINWALNDVKAGDDFPIFVSIETKSSSNSLFIWLAVLAVLALACYIGYNLYKGRKPSIKENKAEKAPIESHLIESEKTVINLLKQADRGEMWQRELQIKTGFSKAKLSRVIRNLESRNLVDKVPFGNTNKIRLL
jgi:uncharacterized membrane protein